MKCSPGPAAAFRACAGSSSSVATPQRSLCLLPAFGADRHGAQSCNDGPEMSRSRSRRLARRKRVVVARRGSQRIASRPESARRGRGGRCEGSAFGSSRARARSVPGTRSIADRFAGPPPGRDLQRAGPQATVREQQVIVERRLAAARRGRDAHRQREPASDAIAGGRTSSTRSGTSAGRGATTRCRKRRASRWPKSLAPIARHRQAAGRDDERGASRGRRRSRARSRASPCRSRSPRRVAVHDAGGPAFGGRMSPICRLERRKERPVLLVQPMPCRSTSAMKWSACSGRARSARRRVLGRELAVDDRFVKLKRPPPEMRIFRRPSSHGRRAVPRARARGGSEAHSSPRRRRDDRDVERADEGSGALSETGRRDAQEAIRQVVADHAGLVRPGPVRLVRGAHR